MRRLLAVMLVSTFVCGSFAVTSSQSSAAPTAVGTCPASGLQVEYSTMRAGTGNVNLFFLIRNLGPEACSLRGFPRAAFVGPHGTRLQTKLSNGADRDGNDLGGLRPGLAVPTVVLAAKKGVASFSLYFRDMPPGNTWSNCFQSRTMITKLPGVNGSYRILLTPNKKSFDLWCGGITMHPIVAGQTGADPPDKFL